MAIISSRPSLALVKTRWPGYTADQVMERVRATCDNIDVANPSRVGQLGKGRVNAEAALTKNTPAVRITSTEEGWVSDDAIHLRPFRLLGVGGVREIQEASRH